MCKNSCLATSPTKFKVDLSSNEKDDVVSLSQLSQLANFQRICVRAKVITVKEPEEVKKGLVKRTKRKIILWESNVAPGVCYLLSG